MQKSTEIQDLKFLSDQQADKFIIKLPKDNLLIVDQKNGEIKLKNNKQETQFSIKIQNDELLVSINAAKLNITATEELNLNAKKINIEASEQINLKSSGNLVQEIGKDCLTEIVGTNKSIAKEQKITANLGNVEIKANDNIKLQGEQVLLNCE